MALPLPVIPVEMSIQQEQMVRAYIWAIAVREAETADGAEARAIELWECFAETYTAIAAGPYAKPPDEAIVVALGRI
jgi:hypothetical protein